MPAQGRNIICFGSIMTDILTSGVNQLPTHWEETLIAQNNSMGIGGGAANSAIAFSRLGEKVKLIARIGTDEFGNFAETILKNEGVQTDLLVKDLKLSTGVAIGIVHNDGKRCFIVTRGANAALSKEDVYKVKPEETMLLHVNGYFQFPGIEKDLESILEEFKKGGTLISFDTASWDPSEKWYESIRSFSRHIDYFFANSTQMYKLTGFSDMDRAAEFLLKDNVKNVIVKLGADGCAIYRNNEKLKVDGYNVDAVDTTGAGDSFDAAYLLGLTKGWDSYKSAKFANIAAALNCTKLGATAGIPSFEETLNLLEKNLL